MFFILTFQSEEEREKFEFIYGKYRNLLLHKAYEVLHDYMLAEDAASEAFLRIYKNLHKVEDPASPRSVAFYVTIVKNVAITMLGKEKKQEVEEYDEAEPDSFDLEQDALARLSSQRIYQLVNELGEELKSVFLLKFAYDMSHKEIGRVLQITENNVTVRLHRAKKKLSKLLVKEGYAG